MQKGRPFAIVLIICFIVSLILAISINKQYAQNKMDPHTQYEVHHINVAEKYGDGFDIHFESHSEHPLRISVKLHSYIPNPESEDVTPYVQWLEIYLKPGHTHTYSSDESKILINATVEQVIVEPTSPVIINLTLLGIFTLIAFGIEIFLVMDENAYADTILRSCPYLTFFILPLCTIISTTMWMKLFMWITQMLIRVDVQFRIFGFYFNI